MEAGGACENVSPLGFLVECLSRQTCLPACAYLGWKGENLRGKEGEGLPLEQLTLFPVKLAEDTRILQGEH